MQFQIETFLRIYCFDWDKNYFVVQPGRETVKAAAFVNVFVKHFVLKKLQFLLGQALFLCVFRKLKVGLKKLKPEFEQETQGIGVNLIFVQKN